MRGYSNVTLLVIDEASRVEDQLYMALRLTVAVSQGRLIALSTRFGRRGWWWSAWEGAEAWHRFKAPAYQCPRISAAFLEAERRTLAPWVYRQEYGCEAMPSSAAPRVVTGPEHKEDRMPIPSDMLTVAEAAAELGISPTTIHRAVGNGTITPHTLDERTYLIPREQVERYRRDSLGNPGGRKRPDEALTEQQRKQRAYQQAYYQRRKAARQQQPAPEPAE